MRPAWRARRSSLSSSRWPKRLMASSSAMRSALIGTGRSVTRSPASGIGAAPVVPARSPNFLPSPIAIHKSKNVYLSDI